MRIQDLPQIVDFRKVDGATEFTSTWGYFILDLLPKLNVNPDYQRDLVWSEEQSISYIEHRMSGGMHGDKFLFNRTWENSEFRYEVIDGKQRINSIVKFMNNRFKVFDKYFAKDISDITHSTLRQTRMWIKACENLSREEILNIYIALNSTGKAHTKEEIDKVKNMLFTTI